ncbi:MAG: glycosyltransferase family 87 protein [Terriglobales bacterium]
MKTEQREELIAGLFALLGLGVLVFLMVLSARSFGAISDFPEYYSPARLICERHGAGGYSLPELTVAQHAHFPSMGERVVPLFVPPPGLAMLSPIGIVSPKVGTIIWKILCGTCLGVSLCFLRKTFALNRKQLFYLIAALSLSDACYEALRIDQLAPVLLLGFAGSLFELRRKRDIRAGFWLSLFMLKPQQFVPLLAFLIGARKWKPLLICAGCWAVLGVLSLIQIGMAGWQNYFSLLALPDIARYQQPELTPTLRGQLLRLFPANAHLVLLITAMVYCVVIALAFWWGWKYRRAADPFMLAVLFVMPLTVVASVHCHNYDLLVIVPTILALFKDSVVETKSATKLVILVIGLMFMLPFSINVHYDYLLKGGLLNPYFFALVGLAVLCCWLVSKYPTEKGRGEAMPRPAE